MAVAGEASVLILTGAPGVGKTTTARILAARSERAVHLESDQFFQFIRSGYVEPWKPESHVQNRIVMGIVAEAAATYAATSRRRLARLPVGRIDAMQPGRGSHVGSLDDCRDSRNAAAPAKHSLPRNR